MGEREESIKIDERKIEALVLGGAVLGGGGGGWIEEGKKVAFSAFERGFHEILSLNHLRDDSLLLTVSAVGAPSAGKDLLEPEDYVRVVEYFIQKTSLKIEGLISSEIGALGVVNGWLQSAHLGIPVIDAPCNGRAHPLTLMGSMGLQRQKGYISKQAAVGRREGIRVEYFFSGNIESVSTRIREAAIASGGMVAVARNPCPVHYVRKHGAEGAIKMALQIGEMLLEEEKKPEIALKKILSYLGGKMIGKGYVEEKRLRIEKGLDLGILSLKTERGRAEISIWNEYMTLELNGIREATFPDLIMTFDSQSLTPLISAQIEEGNEVFLIFVPAGRLILGEGVKDSNLLRLVAEEIGKNIP